MSYDLFFTPLPLEQQHAGPLFTWGAGAVQAVAGPQKLYNRFLKKWLTKRGTNASRPLEGTEFANLLGNYNITSFTDLVDVVSLTIDDAVAQVIEDDQSSNTPPEERMASVTIESLTETEEGDGFDLYIRITNQANASFVVQVPTTL
jgi:hypothetical protein